MRNHRFVLENKSRGIAANLNVGSTTQLTSRILYQPRARMIKFLATMATIKIAAPTASICH